MKISGFITLEFKTKCLPQSASFSGFCSEEWLHLHTHIHIHTQLCCIISFNDAVVC